MSATKTTIVAVVIIGVAFTSGFFVGAFVDHVIMMRRPHRIPEFATHILINRLDRQLDLSAEQRKQIREIIERRHHRVNGLLAGVHPQIRREVDATNAEISAVLTPEQRAKFEKMKLHVGRHGRP